MVEETKRQGGDETVADQTGGAFSIPNQENPADQTNQHNQAIDDSTRLSSPRHGTDPIDLPDLRERSEDQEWRDGVGYQKEGETPSDSPRAEFTTVYDIIDQVQAMLDEAKTPLFSPGMVKVSREELDENLNQLKKMLPVQLERASALMREAEHRLHSAQTQANATISAAQSRSADIVREAGQQAQFLAGQENVVAIAQQKAQAIIDKAQTQADKLVQGANGYASQVMQELQTQLDRVGQDVQVGLGVLQEREQEAARTMNQDKKQE